MKILRTCGGGDGGDHSNERLKIVRNILNHFSINHIDLLHDHKGTLTVFWQREPSGHDKSKVTEIWAVFAEYEIEHKLITYIDL